MFRDADWVILLGAHPRTPGMTRAELLDINGQIFQEQVSYQRATKSLPQRSEVFPFSSLLVLPCLNSAFTRKFASSYLGGLSNKHQARSRM